MIVARQPPVGPPRQSSTLCVLPYCVRMAAQSGSTPICCRITTPKALVGSNLATCRFELRRTQCGFFVCSACTTQHSLRQLTATCQVIGITLGDTRYQVNVGLTPLGSRYAPCTENIAATQVLQSKMRRVSLRTRRKSETSHLVGNYLAPPAFFCATADSRALTGGRRETRTVLISTSSSLRVCRNVLRWMPRSLAALT